MKRIASMVALGFVVSVGSWKTGSRVAAASAQPTAGPFTSQELQDYRAIAPIDTHAHVFSSDPAIIALLKRLDLHILDILVVSDIGVGHGDLATQRREAWAVAHAASGHVALCTTFDPYSFNKPGFAQNTVR